MPDKLAHPWWSPVLPVNFFLSSIAAGTALIILHEMWIAAMYDRRVRSAQLAAMGQIAFWSLLAYHAFRLGDLAVRGELLAAFEGPKAPLFIVELLVGGAMPQTAPTTYWPSVVEWAGSIGLVAASILLFGLGARLMPVLPQDEAAHEAWRR
jgi:formate dehydrogenase iron-sulfur subunit